MSRTPRSGLVNDWSPGQPVEAWRLNLNQQAGVFEIKVQQPGPLRLYRSGNVLTIGYRTASRITDELWIKLTGAAPIGSSTTRWQYTWLEQRPLQGGRWENVPGGLTHSTDQLGGYAYNTIEANNANTGVQGNGVDVSLIPAGFAFRPASYGTPVVHAWRVQTCDGPSEWHFSFENAVTGTCP